MATITYRELSDRLNACKLFNKAPELDEEIYDGIVNGTLGVPCEKHDTIQDDCGTEPIACGEEWEEIYQWYLIDPSDAEYLKSVTDELVFYSDILDEYVWGVTHYGTSWDGVTLEVKS